jgi:hypothetical protein
MNIIPIVVGAIAIAVGIKTVLTQRASVSIRLWGGGSSNGGRHNDGGYSESEHTGFMAVMIGIGEIAIGVGIIFHASS